MPIMAWWCAWCVSGPTREDPKPEHVQQLDGGAARIALGLELRSVWFCGPACVREWDKARRDGFTLAPDAYLSLRRIPMSLATGYEGGTWSQWERRGLVRYVPGSTQAVAHVFISRALPTPFQNAARGALEAKLDPARHA